MHEVGGTLLENVINSDGGDYRGRKISCTCGQEKDFIEYRYKKIQTVLSKINVKRSYYHCDKCNEGICPKDRELDIVATSFSPGVRRMMGLVGAHHPFQGGKSLIEELAGIALKTKSVERVSESIGEQLCRIERGRWKEALSGKIIQMEPVPIFYVAIDGTAVPTLKGWKEAKLGCCFTQTIRDEEGHPVRDPRSTTYTAGIENAELFGQRIFAEATMRGIQSAEKVVVIGDGARWIWNIADEHFYGAIQIVDLYHAREHIWDLGKVLYGAETAKTVRWVKVRHLELDTGNIESLLDSLKSLRTKSEEEKEKIRQEIGYFENNKRRMRYREFRDEGLFIGSGVVEAGCKSVIAHRLKQSGMRWTIIGANTIISLRTCLFNGTRWEDYWANRSIA